MVALTFIWGRKRNDRIHNFLLEMTSSEITIKYDSEIKREHVEMVSV